MSAEVFLRVSAGSFCLTLIDAEGEESMWWRRGGKQGYRAGAGRREDVKQDDDEVRSC